MTEKVSTSIPAAREPAGSGRSGVAQPHDNLFKLVMGEPVNAVSVLRAALPSRLVEQLELDALASVPGSFIDHDLRASHSDTIFSVPFAGRPAFIYALVEHQSTQDAFMALRVAVYVLRFLTQWRRENRRAKRLPLVIPVVVYTGRRPWTRPTRLRDLFDVGELGPQELDAVVRGLPEIEFVIDNLPAVSEEQLRARDYTEQGLLGFLAFRFAPGNRGIVGFFEERPDDMRRARQSAGGAEFMVAFVVYLGSVSKAPAEELHHLAHSLGPDVERAYMTTFGAIESRAEGRVEGRIEALLRQLTRRFGTLDDLHAGLVRSATAEQLDTWTDRVVDPSLTIDQILA